MAVVNLLSNSDNRRNGSGSGKWCNVVTAPFKPQNWEDMTWTRQCVLSTSVTLVNIICNFKKWHFKWYLWTFWNNLCTELSRSFWTWTNDKSRKNQNKAGALKVVEECKIFNCGLKLKVNDQGMSVMEFRPTLQCIEEIILDEHQALPEGATDNVEEKRLENS